MNVHPDHRGHGLGGALVKFLMPNFARVVGSKVAWFCARGYRAIGDPKKGQSLSTQLMARDSLFALAGRLKGVFGQIPKTPADPGPGEKGSTPALGVRIRTGQKTTGSVKP